MRVNRFKNWLTRPDFATDVQRAKIALLLVWFGGAVGVFMIVLSALTDSLVGVMQGLAVVILAIGVRLQSSHR